MRFRDYLFVFVAFAIPALCLGDEPPSVSAVSFNVYEFMESSPDLEPEAPPAVALIAVNAVSNCRCTDCPNGGNCEDCDCPTFAAAKPAFPNLTVPFGNLPTGMICGPDGCKLPERAGTVCGPNGCSQPSSSTAIYSGSWTPTRQVYRRGLFGKWRRVK